MVLCVRLRGYAENSPDGVGRVRDGLDELAASIDEPLDVTTLDVRGFSNASDDACSILTSVFVGLPCCWITDDWDQQRGGARWDLPQRERMAPTGEAALARVVGWRRAGGFSIVHDSGYAEAWRWTERGLVVTTTDGGALDSKDLFHRNNLVERVLANPPRRVLWPVRDRTGATHEAVRLGARLLCVDDEIVEVDYSRWSTRRPLPDDWLAQVTALPSLRELDLRTTLAREADILRAVEALPVLATLHIDRGALGRETLARLERERPALTIR